jgi:alkylresorcinol/alkylpyrone synthase
VVDATEVAFGLAPGVLRDERAVLRDFGNMSAATVLFVLDRMLAAGGNWNRALLSALGPGFTAGFVVLDNR